MPEAIQAAVIGAGPAGLAVSACLRRTGIAHVLLERESSVAPSWRRHYDRLHLHTDRARSTLPGAGYPPGTPRYPSRDQVVAYLERYAAEQAAPARLGVEVRAAHRTDGAWRLETTDGALRARHVVVATGVNAVPPPGAAEARARRLHYCGFDVVATGMLRQVGLEAQAIARAAAAD